MDLKEFSDAEKMMESIGEQMRGLDGDDWHYLRGENYMARIELAQWNGNLHKCKSLEALAK